MKKNKAKEFQFEELYLGLVDIDGVPPSLGRRDALKMIADHLSSGAPLHDVVRQWFCDSVDSLNMEWRHEGSPASNQRLLAKSFGFTQKQGGLNRSRESQKIAECVCIIQLIEGCSAAEAIERYTARKWPTRPEMYDSIYQAYYRYKDAVMPSAENFLETYQSQQSCQD